MRYHDDSLTCYDGMMSNRQERRSKHFRTGDTTVRVTSTGQTAHITGQSVDRITDSTVLGQPAPGAHLWVSVASFRVTHPERWTSEEQYLDQESLMYVSPPGCFVCEQVWDPIVGALPCPGEPT